MYLVHDCIFNSSELFPFFQAWLLNDMLVFAAKGVSRSSEVEKTLDLATLWCMDLGGDNPQSGNFVSN